MIKNFLEIGEIVGTHGIRGEMRVNPWCDSPDFICKFKTLYYDSNGSCAVQVKSARPHGNIVLLTINDVDSVEKAQKLRGKVLYMKRSDARLPKGKYFIAELIGCKVFDADNEEIVKKVSSYQKKPTEERTPNQQLVGDKNFVVDKSLGLVFY